MQAHRFRFRPAFLGAAARGRSGELTPVRLALLLLGGFAATAAGPPNRCAHVDGLASSPLLSVKQLQDMRYPQLVRVGSLKGAHVIMPGDHLSELGVVVGVFKPSDDDPQLVFRYRSVFGVGGRVIAPGLDDVDLVGPYVKVVDLNAKDLHDLPTFTGAGGAFLGADETICLGVDRKY